MKNKMGLMHWRNKNSDLSGYVLMVLIYLLFLFFYVRGIIRGDMELALIIIFGILLLFYAPFSIIPGIIEIVDYIQNKRNKE